MNYDAFAGAALPVSLLALMGVALWCRPAVRHARVIREGGTVFLSETIMHRAYSWIDGLSAIGARQGIRADAISWLSLAFGLASGLMSARGWLGGSAWALALSGLCDGLDGAIARRSGTATAAGAVLDSALDRYVEFFFCAGLLVLFAGQTYAQLLVLVTLFGGFMVTYSTAKAEALGIKPPRGWMKRPERLVWLTGGAALAAAGQLLCWPLSYTLLGTLGVVAIFANLSAILRLRALVVATKNKT